MALVKHNNNSISDLTSAGQLAQGKMTLISSQTASGSASIEFTSGIDSTYPIYRFEFINIHPSSTSRIDFHFNGSTDSGSNYNVTKTTTVFRAYHFENDSGTTLDYDTGNDLAQSTSYQEFYNSANYDNDGNGCGHMYLYNPSSTTFVKHFMTCFNNDGRTSGGAIYSLNEYVAGYFNTTNSIDAMDFKFASGNIDSGTIKLYGIKGD